MKKAQTIDEIYIEIGRKLRFYRENLGYTLDEFCNKINRVYSLELNPNLIGKIERGKSRIQLHDFIYICHFYGIQMHELYPSHLKNRQENPQEAETVQLLLQNTASRQILREISRLKEPELQKVVFSFLNSVMPLVQKLLVSQEQEKKASSTLRAASKNKKRTKSK